MLECNGLWISWHFDVRPSGLEAEAERYVNNLETNVVVGRVRYHARPKFAAWRTTEALRVEEGSDLSDLCAVRRLPWWEAAAIIVDAEGQPVARWSGSLLELPREGLRATVKFEEPGGPGRAWLGGVTIAVWARE